MCLRIGYRTMELERGAEIKGFAGVCGSKEGEGPLKKFFDKSFKNNKFGKKTWEESEGVLQKEAVNRAIEKSGVDKNEIDFILAGDLLDQCVSSMLGLKGLRIPFLGQFGACSTMAQTILVSSLLVESGGARNAVAVTSSHFCSAERQYRFPVDYGGQRTPNAQWTVTGAGALVLGEKKVESGNPYVKRALAGTIEDFGVTDSSNMGAAMAPAASSTLKKFFDDTKSTPKDYDLILTGDLGEIGSKLLIEILSKEGIDISGNYNDCGLMIYYKEEQDVHAGGSGCGCSASVLCSYIMQKIKQRELNNVLFVATGALMSPTSFQQGKSIPGIAHLVQICN